MSVLTFKYLRELQKSERDSSVLQKIDSGFYESCSECLKTDSSEAENIKPLIKSILDMRERKTVTLAMQSARTGIKPENLLSEEEALFSKIADILKTHRILIDNVLLEKGAPKEIKETQKGAHDQKNDACDSPVTVSDTKKDFLKIRAISDIPAFVAEDMKPYGPLASGQVAELPKKAAEVLINAKVAEKAE